MYVCICNAVTDQDIRDAYDDGVRTMRALQKKTGAATCCGCCGPMARQVLASCRAQDEQATQIPDAVLGQPAGAVAG